MYSVCSSTTIEDLVKKVNICIKDDWVCQGGVAILYLQEKVYFYQALVKPITKRVK